MVKMANVECRTLSEGGSVGGALPSPEKIQFPMNISLLCGDTN